MNLEKFLAEKKTCLTATQIGALLGVSRYGKTASDVYDYYIYPREQKQTPDMLRGQELEPIVLDKYEKIMDCGSLYRQPALEGKDPEKMHKGLYRLCERPDIKELVADDFTSEELQKAYWLGCHPDGLIIEDGHIIGAVEIKTVKSSFDLEAKGIYPDHIIQCQTILLCTGAPWIDLCYFDVGRWNLVPDNAVTERIYPDPKIWHSILMVARKFWHDNILQKVPPAQNHIVSDFRVESEELSKDIDKVEDDLPLQIKLTELAKEAVEANIELKAAERKRELAYQALDDATIGRKKKKFVLPGYVVNRVVVNPAPKIDYSRMVKELNIDVSPFLSASLPYSYMKATSK